MTDFFTMQPGETAAPVPEGPLLCGGTDSMRKVHRVFLWGYDEIPGLIRSAADGDTERSSIVGEALRNFDKLLHVHHDGEDELMYPKLAARAPASSVGARRTSPHRKLNELPTPTHHASGRIDRSRAISFSCLGEPSAT